LKTLIERFSPATCVRVYSRTHVADGKDFFTLQEAATADIVILAVPIHALETWIRNIVPLMRSNAVLVDVSTVKKYPVALLKKYAKGVRYIATHPMFGPESYKKKGGDVTGFRIVVAAHTMPTSVYMAYKKHIATFGFDILEMSADAHDKSSAETLFLTHLVGQIVSRGKFVRTDIDTVSFGYLMDAVESVKHDKKLFRDVFRYNPYCKVVLQKFAVAENVVRTVLAKK
jgi:prephenate dehydrogenase